ncbi:tautomerase family protein [Kineococcus sp. TBRC 1896]|uniref:Tautomerase family protein n=1 Tax=Kineococcus mangrovi TaxID=1660183 RepID=A0ABV4I3X3_9ACTN
MPHARIDLHETHRDLLPSLSRAVLAGMVRGFEMPEDDLFQIFRLHHDGELVYSPTFPEQERTDIVFVEIVAQVGYTDAQKQATGSAISDEIAALGIKRDNVLCVFLEVQGAAWYAATSAPTGAGV